MPAPLRDVPQAAVDLIKSFEGIPDGDPSSVNIDAYLCPAGVWTIGWGHALVDGGAQLKGAANKARARALYPGDIPLENPLLAHEGRLLKVLNGDRARLQAMVNRRLGTTLHDALAVGIDPRGIDIRAIEGVFRITFVKFAEQPAAAEARIADLFAV